MSTLLALLFACGTGEAPSPAPEAPPPPTRPVNLARIAPDRISLPSSSRPNPPDPEFACGKIEPGKSGEGFDTWKASIPIRAWRADAPPAQMKVYLGDSEEPLPWSNRDVVGSWSLRGAKISFRVAPGEVVESCRVVHPIAAEREQELHLQWSGLEEQAFLVRSLEQDQITRTGLMMPAPSEATWALTLPESERVGLSLSGRILDPQLGGDGRSDGALVQVQITDESGETTVIGQSEIDRWGWTPLRFNLSPWAGRHVEVTLSTLPGETELYDYAFLVEPVIYEPKADPKELVMIFIDTLRPDHLGLYGYSRRTSPHIDAWAEGAAIFENARSVAPWTLPSTRSLLTGDRPEGWGEQSHLAEILAENGFATGAVVSNINLGRFYNMDYGWEMYHHERLPSAVEIIDKGLEFLSQHRDRDTAVMLHFMEAHLPYQEPEQYKNMWADEASIDGLPERFGRVTLLSSNPRPGTEEDFHNYIRGRYDQNIRFLNDQLSRLLAALPPDATVVLFSDHGEEFWDHGSVEHGHTLHEEVIRTALVIKDPDIEPARHTAPVSIMDIAPTILELLDVPFEERAGTSLVPLMRGEAGAEDNLWQRPQSFSYLIWEHDIWASMVNGKKWFTQGDAQQLYDLRIDPKEVDELLQKDTPIELAPMQDALEAAVGRPLVDTWRVSIKSGNRPLPGDVIVRHPEGFERAWAGYDPRVERPVEVTLEGDAVRIHPLSRRPPRVVFLEPKGADPAGVEMYVEEVDRAAVPGEAPILLQLAEEDAFDVTLTPERVPGPVEEDYEPPTPEVEEALRALGYVE